MPKIFINEDEWYPVYTARVVKSEDGYHNTFDVSDETLEKWRNVFKLFHDAQREMKELESYAERIAELPVQWWSVIIRTENNYTRYSFYGNVIDAELEAYKRENEFGYKVDLYEASNKHAKLYELELEEDDFYASIEGNST